MKNKQPDAYISINFGASPTNYNGDEDSTYYPDADSAIGSEPDLDSKFEEDIEVSYFKDAEGFKAREKRYLDENSAPQEFPPEDVDYDEKGNSPIKEANISIFLNTSSGRVQRICEFTVSASSSLEQLSYRKYTERSEDVLAYVVSTLLEANYDQSFFFDKNNPSQLPIGSYNKIRAFIKENGFNMVYQSEGGKPQLIPMEALKRERKHRR